MNVRKSNITGEEGISMTLKNSEKVFCLLFSFLLPITFFVSAYRFASSSISGIKPIAICELDMLQLFSLLIASIFFFVYSHNILNKAPFLKNSFIYMGWWTILVILSELVMLIPLAIAQIILTLSIHLIGLYLIILMFANLRELWIK